MDKNKRPPIPPQVQKELWARAAGRCEFKGCNKCLYRDGTTQRRRNASEIAHIISWQPSGPRGNSVESHKLATDISNLMLTCPEHNNLIDDPKYVDQYPIELLRQMKKEHEDRVFRLTGLGQDYSLRVIELISKIQDQVTVIDPADEIDALLPYYPMEETIPIDLLNVESIEEAKRIIDRRMTMFLENQKNESYAAFMMAKIPYCCYLGYVIGDKRKVKTYQHFRDTETWKWRDKGGHIYIEAPSVEKSQDVNLVINISGIIQSDLIPSYPSYYIQADEPGVNYLQAEEQVVEFKLKYREMLDEIRNIHGEEVKIHLFAAVPCPIAFEIGRSLMKNLDPSLILYDKVPDDIKYKKVMMLHERLRSE